MSVVKPYGALRSQCSVPLTPLSRKESERSPRRGAEIPEAKPLDAGDPESAFLEGERDRGGVRATIRPRRGENSVREIGEKALQAVAVERLLLGPGCPDPRAG